MEYFFNLLLVCVGLGIALYFVNKKKNEKALAEEQEKQKKEQLEKKRQTELEQLKIKWEKKKKEFETTGLPILTIETLKLTKNEVCHFSDEAFFCKIKQEITGYEGGSRGTSLRIMKGVSFLVGNYRGHHIKEEVTEKTSGLIYLTSKKIIFTAVKNSSIIKYDDIVTLSVVDNMLQIQTEKKTYLFQVIDFFTFMVTLEYIINKNEPKKS